MVVLLPVRQEAPAPGGRVSGQPQPGPHLLPEEPALGGGALPGAGPGVRPQDEGQVQRERMLPLDWQGQDSGVKTPSSV